MLGNRVYIWVGSIAVFVMRHRGQVGGGRSPLQHIVNVIALNMEKNVSFSINWRRKGYLILKALCWAAVEYFVQKVVTFQYVEYLRLLEYLKNILLLMTVLNVLN
ncbi:uncharacterized protein LOC133818991 [Humulus lupulus]|uniref:uncharacterized protein LOC133818991 n=1 Tax=Humulus lupulus TaxID=3486 RepID=UPI002B40291B|nr:uncharacterized protein LOC133818991 [Humulus lupulus]